MPDNDVTVTPLSTIIEYNITYNDADGSPVIVDNPESYNIETPTFTLKAPIKTGYTFLGWAGSNGSTPELEVTIEQ